MFRLAFVSIIGSLLVSGCGGLDADSPGNTTFKVSECGGFARPDKADAAHSYCDAEVLEWSYDAAKGKLSLTDQRVLLNCCGDHSVKLTQQSDGTFLITETDAPQGGTGRCDCMCVYDFSVSFDIYSAGGKVPIKLVREVTDDKAPAKTVFSGVLDLSKGKGSEVVDKTDVEMWCESSTAQNPPSTNPPAQTYAVSSCGGFGTKSTGSFSYCDAEVLEWSYDAAKGKLSLNDQRVLLNCCGDHSVKVTQQSDGTFLITETDAPQGGTGRCLCMCVYDFQASFDIYSAGGLVPIKLVRDVTDDATATKTLYSGTLNLAAGSGSIVVDSTDAGPFCNQP